MQIFLRHDGTHAFECTEEDYVFGIKQRIEDLHSIAVEEQVLYHNGRVLEDDESVFDCLQNGAHIDLTLRLLGGKVHGSLARAGKVKGQTPKVEKQEKKKKATGRAKRRLQYNRRFVNAVRVKGRRRGPNANA